ncbi:MAG: glycosyltransferase family 4 protein [Flavobacteriales bacterium]|nr:glycosyltransferase family 4 protein [Flavobacteriales bacterium]
MKIKVIQIIANTNKSLAFEIIAKGLMGNNIELHYILLQNGETEFSKYLESIGVKHYIISIKGKTNIIKAFFNLFSLLISIKPDIVHTHMREANLIGLLVAKIVFIKNRIYTRHHSTSNWEYHPKAVKWDKFTNYLSTHIVSISHNVTTVLTLKEDVVSEKITYIPHGININNFKNTDEKRIINLKNKYNIKANSHPIIGVISRYIHLKGLQYIIPAFSDIKKKYPEAFFVFANAFGNDSAHIKNMLSQHLNQEDYVEITFENDLYSLYGMFDFFVHAPINKEIEAFGQTYIESLAAGVPSVFTLSGIANEIIVNEYNALVVNYQSSSEILESLQRLITDDKLRKKIIENGLQTSQYFSDKSYIENHLNLYKNICLPKDKK